MQFLLELGAVIAALAAFGGWISSTNHESFLEEICSGIQGTFHREIRGFRWRYLGRLKFQERPIVLTYAYRLWQTVGRKKEELEIAIPLIQKFWLRLFPQHISLRRRKIIQQESIDIPGFFFVVHSNQPEAAAQFLQQPDVLRQFEALEAFQKLEIHKGMLRVTYRDPAAQFSSESLAAVLTALLQVVFFYEQQPSFRMTVTAESELCPFCRGQFHSREGIFECCECGTRLHEACWKENRHCTTWGCPSITAVAVSSIKN